MGRSSFSVYSKQRLVDQHVTLDHTGLWRRGNRRVAQKHGLTVPQKSALRLLCSSLSADICVDINRLASRVGMAIIGRA